MEKRTAIKAFTNKTALRRQSFCFANVHKQCIFKQAFYLTKLQPALPLAPKHYCNCGGILIENRNFVKQG